MKYIGATLLSTLALSFTAPLWGMDWPSEEARMESNFGANDQGNPVMGTSWAGQGVVRAAETGELLFTRDVNNADRLPSPLGAWVALDHGDGLVSIYSRLETEKGLTLPVTIEKGMVIGNTGVSGWANRSGFYFSLFDRKERRYMNPAMIIQFIQDTKPPVIQAVMLKNSAGTVIDFTREDRSTTKTIKQGTYTVFVAAFDGVDASENTLAPFKLVCSLNGLEVGAVTFETFFSRNGVLLIYRNNPISVRTAYAEAPYFEIGTASFTRGQASLEIIAQDINENFQRTEFKLNVE
ncbi:MAG: M23 family metallopeptidase [Treponema sp.]|nr:M23 family metallopeptidase [Treponema sp.]